MNDIDLNLFRVFAEVFQAQNITRAATKLHLTQPAVSNALARLRDQLNDPLFVREGRRMVPTPRARRIAPQVEAALSALSSALSVEKAAFDPARERRTFVVGMRESPEFAVLPRVAGLLATDMPRASVRSVRFDRAKLVQLLRAASLDFAVDIRMPMLPDDIRAETLFRDTLYLAVRRRHPLRRQLSSVPAWLSLRHVVVSARPRGRLLEDAVLAQLGIERDVAVRCQHYYAACQLIARSDFALLLPRRYGEHWQRELGLLLLPPPVPLPELAVALYWHSSAERDEGLVWVRDRVLRERDSLVSAMR